jgi:hypothetical protein
MERNIAVSDHWKEIKKKECQQMISKCWITAWKETKKKDVKQEEFLDSKRVSHGTTTMP